MTTSSKFGKIHLDHAATDLGITIPDSGHSLKVKLDQVTDLICVQEKPLPDGATRWDIFQGDNAGGGEWVAQVTQNPNKPADSGATEAYILMGDHLLFQILGLGMVTVPEHGRILEVSPLSRDALQFGILRHYFLDIMPRLTRVKIVD